MVQEDSFFKILGISFLNCFSFGIIGSLYNQHKLELYRQEFENNCNFETFNDKCMKKRFYKNIYKFNLLKLN